MDDGEATEVIEPAKEEMLHSDANPNDHDSMADEVEWNDQQSEYSRQRSGKDGNDAHDLGESECNVEGAGDEFDEQQLDESDIKTMRVPELREALKMRALDSTGKKAELQARLRSAVERCYTNRTEVRRARRKKEKKRELQMSDKDNDISGPQTTDPPPSLPLRNKPADQGKLVKQRRICVGVDELAEMTISLCLKMMACCKGAH